VAFDSEASAVEMRRLLTARVGVDVGVNARGNGCLFTDRCPLPLVVDIFQDNLSRSVMQALEARVAKLEVQVQTSVSRSLNKHVNQVRFWGSDVGG